MNKHYPTRDYKKENKAIKRSRLFDVVAVWFIMIAILYFAYCVVRAIV